MKHNIKVDLTPKGQIRLRVTFSGQRVDINVGLSYPPDKWVNGKAKPNTKNDNRQTATEINNSVAKVVETIDQYFAACELQNITPTAEGVKQCYKLTTCAKTITFEQVFTEFVSEMAVARQMSLSRRRSLEWLQRVIIEKYPRLLLRDITTDWIFDFKKQLSEKYKNKTMQLVQVNINQFVKYTNKHKYTHIELRETNLKIKKIHSEAKVFLEDDELKRFQEVELENPRLNYARDVFLFGCYSGLRLSDLLRLNKSDIENDTITIITKKTSKQIHIDLNKHTRRIFEKYQSEYPDAKKVFPINIIQKMNIYLREIANIAKINKLVTISYYKTDQRIEETFEKWQVITSHAARRTFVVQCLERNIPPLVIMKWTGHANLSAMSPYIAIVDTLKKKEMSKFDD